MNVPNNSVIISNIIDKDKTFSGELKKNIIKKFNESLTNKNYKYCGIYLADLISSGYFKDIWNSIFNCVFKDINTNNPTLPYYLFLYYDKYDKIYNSFKKDLIIELRNNQEIRNLFTEISVIVCLSDKNFILQSKHLPKIKNINDYKSKIKASHNNFIKNYLYSDDPYEIIFALNEIAFILNSNDHRLTINNIFYWLEWLMKVDLNYRKNKKEFHCHKIIISDVKEKYHNDWIWVLWRIIKDFCDKINSSFINYQFKSLLYFFKLNFTTASKKNKLPIIQYMLLLIKSDYKINTKLCNNNSLKMKLCLINNIHFINLTKYNTIINNNTNEINNKHVINGLNVYKENKQIENKNNIDENTKYLNIITYKDNNQENNYDQSDNHDQLKKIKINN